MNSELDYLQPYPFERLATLKHGIVAPAALSPIALSIGEPKHTPPPFVLEALAASLTGLAQYPTTAGLPELRTACGNWLERRFGLPPASVKVNQVLPVNGTREALFAFAQAVVDRHQGDGTPLVVMPNPFYQIYEGAARLAGAATYFMDTTAANDYLPDLDAVPAEVWKRTQLLYLCNPGNPTGAVMSRAQLRRAVELADQYDFIIASDECYAELYTDDAAPPDSLLAAALDAGHSGFERCVVFHSLSKRSSLPGLRSGFVAGDASVLEKFLLYRTYHGCSMSVPIQRASILAWQDDAHVKENRRLYREKFASVLPILTEHWDVTVPAGGFYLWPDVSQAQAGMDDERFTRELFRTQNVTVVPGSYLACDGGHGNPGRNRVRISLVASVTECIEAAHRISDFIKGKYS